MGYVLNIVLALGSLGALQLGWTSGRELPWVVPLLVVVPYGLGWTARRFFLVGRFRLGELCERAVSVAPIALQFVAVGELGWLTVLERWTGARITIEGWPSLWMLAGLAPFFLYEYAAIDARARCLILPRDAALSLRSFQLRLFLSVLLLFLSMLGAASLVALDPVLRVRIDEIGLFAALWGTALLTFLGHAAPFFLRYAWDTAALERGSLRSALEDVARRAGFRCRELLVWRTGQQLANAAIVGFTPGTRFVFFTDLLLAQLGPREVAAVFAHEMGHARRAHGPLFVAFGLSFFFSADLALTWSGVTSTAWIVALVALALVLWYLAFGFLSRRFELEADLESLRILGESGPLVRALELVTGAHAHERSSWRHFSTRDRVTFLQRVEREPVRGVKLRLALARWRKLGFALFAVVAALELVQIARTWDGDWIEADLRLGRFDEAAARADAPRVGEEAARLARIAGGIAPENRDPAALERRALQALARGDLERARDLLDLALRQGRDDLAPVVEALQANLGAEGASSVPLDELPSPWREALSSLGSAIKGAN